MWDRFLRACRREPVDTTPVWFMRQAGRYMPEYLAIRKNHSLLDICHNAELCTEVTLQPVLAHQVDAAILFADILLPLEPMGAPFSFEKGEGPVVHRPVRSPADVDALRVIEAEDGLEYVMNALRMIRRELDGKTPLIGFAGAPFTLASYLIEGGKASQYIRTKKFMFSEPEAWDKLMAKLSEVVRRYLRAQVEAGAQCIQLFDSWVGALNPQDYRSRVMPHVQHILQDIQKTGVPVIHFGTGTSTLLELQKEAGGTVMGIDFRLTLEQARARLGDDIAYQGNLDPMLLLAPQELLESRSRQIIEEGKNLPGHIFNLGHGIVPDVNPDAVTRLVDFIHSTGARG
ncbi:MAG: uroporphyrinogen decarboxylase [Polyangiaceae bacterium]|nr:uroporphyrinogen decarboxylase [Polyangiaceae bacterium]